MRKIIFVLLSQFVIISSLVFSQDSVRTKQNNDLKTVTPSESNDVLTPLVGGYRWTQRALIYPSTKFGGVDEKRDPILTIVGQKFTVTRDLGGGFVLLTIDDYADGTEFKTKYNSGPYYVQTNILNVCAVKNLRVKGSLAFGVINFPFKYRIQKQVNDFSGSFNFGAALGVNFGHYAWNKWGFTFLTSYSISNVNLDSVSVGKNADKLRTTNNYTAFSFAGGLMVSYDKVQAGLFLGCDILSRINQATFDWRYQGKPWISVGFGYSIFAGSKTVEGEGGNKDLNK